MTEFHTNQLGMEHIMGSIVGVSAVAPKKRGRPRKNPLPEAAPTDTGGKPFTQELVDDLEAEGIAPQTIYPFHRENKDIISISDFGKSIEFTAKNDQLLDVLKREYEQQRTIRDEAQAKMDYLDGLVAQCDSISGLVDK